MISVWHFLVYSHLAAYYLRLFYYFLLRSDAVEVGAVT